MVDESCLFANQAVANKRITKVFLTQPILLLTMNPFDNLNEEHLIVHEATMKFETLSDPSKKNLTNLMREK